MEEDLFWEYPKLSLDISNKNLEVEGQGSFGMVYRTSYDNRKIALKKIRTSRKLLRDDHIQKIKREINIMEVLKDKHQIVQFIGVYMSERYVFIAMQLAENKSLYDYIQQVGENLDWKHAKRFSYDVSLGLFYLHDIDIYHGDIKACNVLLDAELRAKLCDFGTSKNDSFSINVGTSNRWSPERKTEKYKPDKDDIYALGLLMIEIASFKLYESEFDTYFIDDILQNEDISNDFLEALKIFLKDQKSRPFAKQAVEILEKIIINTKISINKMSLAYKTLLGDIDDDEYMVFKNVQRKAFEGDISAQFTLGKYYYDGYGTQQNHEQAKIWYAKAAEAGNTNAQYNLGIYYYNIERDYDKAKEWYIKASENSDAQNALGVYYQEIEGNYEQAKIWYVKAAEMENLDGQYNLGSYYYYVEENYEKAKLWYSRAAESGNSYSQNSLGNYYENIEKNYDEAKMWYTKAAEAGNADAQNNLANYYCYFEKNYRNAVYWYTNAAETGHLLAQSNLGVFYHYIEKDYEKARRWYALAAEAGSTIAQNNFGYYYKDIEKNYEKAKIMYLSAIEQGNTNSMHSLAEYYQDIEQDYNKALEWYNKSIVAGLNDGYGEHGIGNCYYKQSKYYMAKEWYMKAIDKGCVEAYSSIGQIYLLEGDKEIAYDWYLKGFEAGDEKAKEKLQTINKLCILS